MTTPDTPPYAPASEAEVSALVRDAAARNRPLSTIGNGTKQHHGPAATGDMTVMTLSRLNQITADEPGDMVVSAQAGARLGDVQRLLAERGQCLPLDPPYENATVGGILATNSSGPRRLGYGTAKDMLLGLRVCGSDGIITRSGGRVVKNVTGYDLHKLHIGAFGSLGVVLEATFKVRPRPEVSAAFVVGCADLAAAHALLLDVWGSALRPVALEALAGGAVAHLRVTLPGLPDSPALAIVGYEGSRLAFERHQRDLDAVFARQQGHVILDGAPAGALWRAFRDGPSRDLVIARLGARPHDLPGLLGDAGAEGIVIQVGNGIARVSLAPTGPSVGATIRAWHQRAASKGGYAVVESAPLNAAARATLPWGFPGAALTAAVKASWDKLGIFNPGRMAI